MCLAVPGKVVAVSGEPPGRVAEVEYGSARRTAQLLYLPDVQVGDYVVVQAGFAIRRLSEAEATEALGLLRDAAVAEASAGTA
jgi:hydrogenase expression/formation protein HypC